MQGSQDKSLNGTLSNVILKNRSYERKGELYKKSLNTHNFKSRQFVLLGEQLFYYKKKNAGNQEKYFNLISLQNAKIRQLPKSQNLKLSKYY